jgi:hypothetical protein
LIRKRLKKLRLLEKPDTTGIDQKLLAVKEKMEHIKDSIEAGIDPTLVKDRLEKLDRERIGLGAEKIALNSDGQPDLDINKVVEEIFGLVHRFDDVLRDGPILDAKKVLRAFVERFVIDPDNRVATCYIRKVPITAGSRALENNRAFTDMTQTRPPAFTSETIESSQGALFLSTRSRR